MVATHLALSIFSGGAPGALLSLVKRNLSFKSASASPAARTRAQEADDLRAMADRFVRSDPGFADDLYAAATRHERAA
ncbi:hypothetical protein QTH97_22260 [Variovorax sp. J22R24]|uniref:hypothetical protein n=1 Tax=Variovorax gracilis TaxID=3053502 RepID=UPI0025766E22|nr:hypothetical protein [Variovorax sp. J22R24]MDM0107689.1 hypothetical protein [Variovorax sp. J22R24]